MIVVEIAQFGVEKAGRSGRGDDPGRVHIGDVLPTAVHSALAFLDCEGLLGAFGHVVDHRIPDSAGVLRHVHIDAAELSEHVQA